MILLLGILFLYTAAAGFPPSLVRALAARFETVYAADYLAYRRGLPFPEPTITSPADLLSAQIAAERALLVQANRVLFLEVDLLRSILSTDDAAVLAELAGGSYDDLLEQSRQQMRYRHPPSLHARLEPQ